MVGSGGEVPREKNDDLSNDIGILPTEILVLGMWLSARPTLLWGGVISFFSEFWKPPYFFGGVIYGGGLFHDPWYQQTAPNLVKNTLKMNTPPSVEDAFTNN